MTIQDTRSAASVDRRLKLIATGSSAGSSCSGSLTDNPWELSLIHI